VSATQSSVCVSNGAAQAVWRGCESATTSVLPQHKPCERNYSLVLCKTEMAKKHLTMTRAQHTALQSMLDNRATQLLDGQRGGGYNIPTKYFADVPWAHAARFYVRKSGNQPAGYDDLGAMGQRALNQAGGSQFTDNLRKNASTTHDVAKGIDVVGGVAAATGIGAAAAPFAAAAGLGTDLGAYAVEGIAGLGDLTGWF
jgi:hypothetical protein